MFFHSSPSRPGWVAIASLGDRACAALVEAAETGEDPRPVVRWIEHLGWADPTDTLSRLRRDHAVHRHALLAVLPRTHYRITPFDAPDLPRPEWRDALRWRLQDVIDFPAEDASIDLLEVPAHTRQRPQATVIAVAAPRAPLATLAQQGRRARVRWQAFDIVECALRNLSARCEPDGRGQALLHVGPEQCTLVLTAGGELLLSRTIDVGLPQLLPSEDGAPPAHGDLTPAMDRIALEVQRTLDSFERQFGQVAIARVLVAPDGLDSFLRHMGDLVYTPIEPLGLERMFDIDSLSADAVLALQTPSRRQSDAWIALGAALRAAEGVPA